MQYVLAMMVSDTAKANQLAGYESKGCWGEAPRESFDDASSTLA